MNWRDLLGTKLVSAEQAVKNVQSGDIVAIAPYTTSPITLCNALMTSGRERGLEGVKIEHLASVVPWSAPELQGIFRIRDNYATPPNRAACHTGGMDYLPIGLWKSYEMPAGLSSTPNVFLVPVSTPDRHGYCSFGTGVFGSLDPTSILSNSSAVIEVVN